MLLLCYLRTGARYARKLCNQFEMHRMSPLYQDGVVFDDIDQRIGMKRQVEFVSASADEVMGTWHVRHRVACAYLRLYQELKYSDVDQAIDRRGAFDESKPGIGTPYRLCVWWTPDPRTLDGFHRWYSDEHIPMLKLVPGWSSVMRYKLIAGDGPKFLAVHELGTLSVFDDVQYEKAMNTDWTRWVVDHRIEYERRLFRRRYTIN